MSRPLLSTPRSSKHRAPHPNRGYRPYAVAGGLLALLLVVSAAGRAWLGPAQVISDDRRVQVDYPRLVRSGAEQTLHISVRGEPGKAVKLLLIGPLLSQSRVERISPEPQSSLRQGNALLLHFPSEATMERSVEVTLRSDAVGQLNGTLRAGPGSVVRLSTYRHP
ncbi:hypothetical protein SJI00_21520 [Pseudomonas sp. RP23018S]|uniref:hypothetical protein n=1 Tax=Pseudomonas sp. RP23018S TaxID=3096037 RepID=UPI002ACA0E7F|nr:hypothetical protein [Pseudomonas sp. RP23018S]MDZ5605357.1 hypothetical protein [Pseudomonas sp. RP23018S]